MTGVTTSPICRKPKKHIYYAAQNAAALRRWNICGTQLYSELITIIAAVLPQWTIIEEQHHTGPHIAQASTTGSSSFTVILASCNSTPFPWVIATGTISRRPHPIEPKASVQTSWGTCPVVCEGTIGIPSQEEIKVAH